MLFWSRAARTAGELQQILVFANPLIHFLCFVVCCVSVCQCLVHRLIVPTVYVIRTIYYIPLYILRADFFFFNRSHLHDLFSATLKNKIKNESRMSNTQVFLQIVQPENHSTVALTQSFSLRAHEAWAKLQASFIQPAEFLVPNCGLEFDERLI